MISYLFSYGVLTPLKSQDIHWLLLILPKMHGMDVSTMENMLFLLFNKVSICFHIIYLLFRALYSSLFQNIQGVPKNVSIKNFNSALFIASIHNF